MSLRDAFRTEFNAGLEAAAGFLEATATDYRQMADRVRREIDEFNRGHNIGALGGAKYAEERTLREKAMLLEGQAGHIRNLKT